MTIEILDARQLTETEARSIGELLATVWPKPEKDAEFRTRQMLEVGEKFPGDGAQFPRSFLIRESERTIAHAAVLPRTIGTSAGEFTIAGLALVCSAPDQRGRGLGELIVRAVFELVDSGIFQYSLFQTSDQVKPFYEKLGCCLVENEIVNSLDNDPHSCPFKDNVVMRYPNSGEWPAGEIDLRGPGY